MWTADNWKDYEVIDTCGGEKLERWGQYILVRPDPQVIWNTPKTDKHWKKMNGHYHRSNKGGGEWEFFDLPEQWTIQYHHLGLSFNLKPFSFKHTGLFPEQAANWDWFSSIIKKANRTVKIHAKLSGLPETSVRWIVDDCQKFVEREIRRGNHYDAIIMDPPSYGRGPKGEIWKIETSIYPFIQLCEKLLSDNPLFFLVNSYTTGLQPAVLTYMLSTAVKANHGGHVIADEVGLPVSGNGLVLPCGASGRWEH